MIDKTAVQYSLYLVTDSSEAILGNKNLLTVVENAIRGGVKVVQLREKHLGVEKFIELGREMHKLTRSYGIPLLINDRVDVAQAVGCEGVHLGQDDTDIRVARRILGPHAIIGASASTPDEALAAIAAGADYLGLGPVFATPTKPDATAPIGVDGLRAILAALPSSSSSVPRIPTVCIGGINRDNAGDVISRSSAAIGEGIKDADSARTMRRTLDGVAVVSAIVAAADEHAAAADLLGEVVKARASLLNDAPDAVKQAAASLLNLVPPVLTAVARSTPLSHNMTNTVVQNFAANVALAIGGSPIMSTNADEASDLARLGGGLVVNIGTLMPGDVDAYVTAIAAYNSMSADAADGRSPVVFDPVGAGASELRKSAVRRILAHPNRIAILKGNEGEIAAVDALTTPPDEKSDRKGEEQKQQRGVDSTSTLAPRRLASLVRRLARRLRCVVVLTGATDYVAGVPPRPPPELQTAGKDDADVAVFAVRNGHPILGRITGSGCALGTVMSCTAAVAAGTVQHAGVSEGHMMVAAMAALLFFDVAGEEAVVTTDVHGRPVERGPGSFVPAFLDALADLSGKAKLGDTEKLMGRANVVRVTEFDD